MARIRAEQRVLTVGAPGTCDLEFAGQYVIKNPTKALQIELPGEVLRVRGQCFAAVPPITRVVLAGKNHQSPRSAVLQFASKSVEDVEKALAPLRKVLSEGRCQDFKILVRASGMTFGEVVERAIQGKLGRTSPASVEIRVSVAVKGRRQPVISGPMGGLMADTGVPGVSEDTLDYEDFWGLHFACHSHWYSDPQGRHFTVCHGPCSSGGPCSCGGRAQVCWGWHFCWC